MPPKSYTPPFSITPDIINAVAAISEAVGRIAAFDAQASSLKLRRANRIRTIHGSLAMAGNTLNIAQITAIRDALEQHTPQVTPKPALALELIEMTRPDKPNSRLQQYRLTEKALLRLWKQ